MPEDDHRITRLLADWRAGEPGAEGELMNLVYAEMRQLASGFMRRERQGHTLQTTALVHEVYLRLCKAEPIDWQNRAHFFAVAAQQLRRILVDYARASQAAKRGRGMARVSLASIDPGRADRSEDVLALDQALRRLDKLDPRASRVVELRYLAGLSEREAAEAFSISPATLKRDWEFARTWLVSQLR